MDLRSGTRLKRGYLERFISATWRTGDGGATVD